MNVFSLQSDPTQILIVFSGTLYKWDGTQLQQRATRETDPLTASFASTEVPDSKEQMFISEESVIKSDMRFKSKKINLDDSVDRSAPCGHHVCFPKQFKSKEIKPIQTLKFRSRRPGVFDKWARTPPLKGQSMIKLGRFEVPYPVAGDLLCVTSPKSLEIYDASSKTLNLVDLESRSLVHTGRGKWVFVCRRSSESSQLIHLSDVHCYGCLMEPLVARNGFFSRSIVIPSGTGSSTYNIYVKPDTFHEHREQMPGQQSMSSMITNALSRMKNSWIFETQISNQQLRRPLEGLLPV